MITTTTDQPAARGALPDDLVRDAAYFEPAWRGNFRGDGGPAMALGIHQIDLMLSKLGPWQEVSAFATP